MPDERASDQGLGTIEAEFRAWLSAHPAATLTELEIELDRRLRAGRAQILREAVTAMPNPAGVCPDCGRPLVAHGQHVRRLVTQGDEPLTVERSYQRCPACGAGLFPPG
ncbi:MAG TPA: hypothetical protein DEU95_02300 [Chloroflexi bacterium]|jgi:ribosomal protein S27AE|nr:hypothetical protein [Chloroflexota bacterium]